MVERIEIDVCTGAQFCNYNRRLLATDYYLCWLHGDCNNKKKGKAIFEVDDKYNAENVEIDNND